MSTLDSLIRVNRWKLDERRRQLGELERLSERLGNEAIRLEQELASEQQVASASLEAGYRRWDRRGSQNKNSTHSPLKIVPSGCSRRGGLLSVLCEAKKTWQMSTNNGELRL